MLTGSGSIDRPLIDSIDDSNLLSHESRVVLLLRCAPPLCSCDLAFVGLGVWVE